MRDGAQQRDLGIFSLAALLVSAHYGLGFLLGTGEKAFTLGTAGCLYAVSVALGTLALLFIGKFYWQQTDPLWTLLGNRYGQQAKVLTGAMSWSALVGVGAVQTIAGAFILKVLGVPVVPAMVGLTLAAAILSALPLQRAGIVFRSLLLFNVVVLFYGLWALGGLGTYAHAPLEFVPQTIDRIDSTAIVSVSLLTIVQGLLDVKYQQFIVRAKSLRSLYLGILLASGIFLLLAFVPSTAIAAAQAADILPARLTGKEAIPYILAWLGGGSDKPLGILLVLALVVPALGVGSSVLRMQAKAVQDFNLFAETPRSRLAITAVNASLGLLVALQGGTIVNLLVCFYAAFISATGVPLVAYLLAHTRRYEFPATSVRAAMWLGGGAALTALTLSLAKPEYVLFGRPELHVMALGTLFSTIGLFGGQFIDRSGPLLPSAPSLVSGERD